LIIGTGWRQVAGRQVAGRQVAGRQVAGRQVAGREPIASVDVSTDVRVHDAGIDDLEPRTLYEILALRSDVFVVEQDCPYLDPDGRDLEPGARQLWIEHDGAVVATLRLLETAAGAARIGRVATARNARGQGLAKQLMGRALQLCRGRDVVLNAQSYLEQWYVDLGFVRDGDDYLEDGIPHLPMRLRRESSSAPGPT
jgi:ElaA protein